MTEHEAREAATDAGDAELAIAMRRAVRNMDEGLDDLMSAELPASTAPRRPLIPRAWPRGR